MGLTEQLIWGFCGENQYDIWMEDEKEKGGSKNWDGEKKKWDRFNSELKKIKKQKKTA